MERRDISFPYGCDFKTELQINSFNDGFDLVAGSISKIEKPKAIYIAKMAEMELMSRDVWLDTESAHVVYIMGSRRGGKSYTLGVIAESLVSDSLSVGGLENAVLILDTLNLFWTMEHPTSDESERKNLSEWGLATKSIPNIAIYYPRGLKKDWMSDHYKEFSISTKDIDVYDLANLFELNLITDPQGQLLSEVFEKVTKDGYISSLGRIAPRADFSINDLLRCLDEDSDLNRFPDSTREAVRRRLKALEREKIFSEEGTDMRELFVKGKITDLLLMDLEQQVRGLVIGVLVRKIFRLRGETTSDEKKLKILGNTDSNSQKVQEIKQKISQGIPRGWILIDEGHNYMPANRQIGSLMPLTQYVNEGRNLGLSLAITTQNPAGIHSSVQRNADVLIIHKIGIDSDLKAAEGMLRNTVPDQVEFVNGEKHKTKVFDKVVRDEQLGYALISAENTNRVIYVRIRPRMTVHGGLNY